jgi:hypothetical protein
MAGITTSLVIRFQTTDGAAAENAILSAELDSREEGLNAGKNRFIYGDSPAYLIYRTDNVTYTQQSTAGSVQYVETGSIEVIETISFVADTESNLSKPPLGGVTFTLVAGNGIDVSQLTVVGTKVTSPTEGLAVVKAQYNTRYEAYRLTNVSDPMVEDLEDYEVIIYILGTVT